MSSPNRQQNRITILSTAPVSFLLLGFQGFVGVKFSCPCSPYWNQGIVLLILIVPAFFVWLMMQLFLKFEENNSRRPEEQENRERSQKQLYCMIRFIPSLMWICIFFIDGDYFACAFAFYEGIYIHDKHPNCVSWCKPNLKQATNDTEYNRTQAYVNTSKVNTKYFYPILYKFQILSGKNKWNRELHVREIWIIYHFTNMRNMKICTNKLHR